MIATELSLIDQIYKFHMEYDTIEHNPDRLKEWIQFSLDRDRYSLAMDGDRLLGYVESWRINYEQFGWIMCNTPTPPNIVDWEWNISDGNIAYLANIVIHPDFRGKTVIKLLKNMFWEKNFVCDFFLGEAKRKKHQPVKVFNKQQFWKKYGEVKSNG